MWLVIVASLVLFSVNAQELADELRLPTSSVCDDPTLKWRSGKKTHYTSYPKPDSEECVKYNGCKWAGYFAYCNGKQKKRWVKGTNIAAVFPIRWRKKKKKKKTLLSRFVLFSVFLVGVWRIIKFVWERARNLLWSMWLTHVLTVIAAVVAHETKEIRMLW